MRFFLGMIVGILLTVGGAYLYDSATTPSTETTGSIASSIDRPMVNWEVVDNNWSRWTSQLRQEWHKLAAK
jgi:hypothetical protein